MKSKALAICVALCGLGLSMPAGAQSDTNRTVSVVNNPSGPPTVIVEDKTLPNLDVTSAAGRFGEGADIAVTGTVASKDNGSIVLKRRDGDVRALISDPGDDRVAVGDIVTVYGKLKREPLDIVQVETEVVYDKTADKSYLTMQGHERTAQSAAAGQTVKLNYHPI